MLICIYIIFWVRSSVWRKYYHSSHKKPRNSGNFILPGILSN